MLDKVIVYQNAEGNTAIVNMAPEMWDSTSRTRQALEQQGIKLVTDQDVLDYIIKRSIPEGVEWHVVPKDSIPEDRTFRNAWTHDSSAIFVDMVKARDLKMGDLRKVRNAKLKSLDVTFMLALEKGDSEATKEIATKKQELRDLPQTVSMEHIDTPEALKDFTPEILND